MKIALIALLFTLPAFADANRPYQFETEPGCMWKKNEARCVLQNRFKDRITCQVFVTGKTLKGQTIGKTYQVVVPAQRFDDSARIHASEDDELIEVTATADCTAQ